MVPEAEKLFRLLVELGRRRSLRDPVYEVVDSVALTRPQLHAVLWLGVEGPLSSSALARRVGSSLPSSTGVVDRLEALGLVRRARKEGDRRVVLVELTPEGEALSGRLQGAVVERLSRVLGAMDAADQRALLDIFGRLLERVRKLEAEHGEPLPPLEGAGGPGRAARPRKSAATRRGDQDGGTHEKKKPRRAGKRPER